MADQTPTEMLIERLEDIDDVKSAFVLWRRENGAIGYRCANMDTSELMGFLRFAQLSIEQELIDAWRKE